MNRSNIRKWMIAAVCATAMVPFSFSAVDLALAQSHEGGQQGSHASGDDHGDDHGEGGRKVRRGASGGERGGAGGGSLRDVFHDMEAEAGVTHDEGGHEDGGGSDQGKKVQAGKSSEGKGRPETAGGQGGKPEGHEAAEGEEEDSDRPDWAGVPGREGKPGRPNTDSGTKMGTIYGDMYVVERDDDGVPELDGGYEQVYYIVTEEGSENYGEIGCCIPRNEEGDLLTSLPDGTSIVPLEVELGRLSVGRSPERVLAAQLEEAIKSINEATSVELDASGRIVLTLSDGTVKTIDSPVENLALYTEIMNTGTLDGVDLAKLAALGIDDSGGVSSTELDLAKSFFAAASDKTISVTVDSVVYMNKILGVVGDLPDGYVDYSDFTYNRETVYSGLTVLALVETSPGVWTETNVNVYDVILGGQATGDLTNVAAFTTAADDARLIIDFLHEFGVPETD